MTGRLSRNGPRADNWTEKGPAYSSRGTKEFYRQTGFFE